MKEVSATITTTQVRMVIMVTAEIDSAPPASFKVGRFTTEVNCLVLEPKISSADGGDQNGQRRGAAQRLVCNPLNGDAQQRADDDRRQHSQHRRHAQGADHGEGGKRSYHYNIAVGEVQHLGNTVHHRIT